MGVRHCERSEAISQGFRTQKDCFGRCPRNDVSLTFLPPPTDLKDFADLGILLMDGSESGRHFFAKAFAPIQRKNPCHPCDPCTRAAPIGATKKHLPANPHPCYNAPITERAYPMTTPISRPANPRNDNADNDNPYRAVRRGMPVR